MQKLNFLLKFLLTLLYLPGNKNFTFKIIYNLGLFSGCINCNLRKTDFEEDIQHGEEIGRSQRIEGSQRIEVGGSKRHDVKKHGKDVASTSHGGGECECKQYNIENNNKNISIQISENEIIELNTIIRIGEGGFGKISHAYWIDNFCVALKVSTVKHEENNENFRKKLIRNEVEVLKYFDEEVIDERQKIFIIKIYHNVEIFKDNKWKMYVLMELGGQTLMNCANQKLEQAGLTPQQVIFYANQKLQEAELTEQQVEVGKIIEGCLINVIKGAARALNQFHRHAIHLDVKANNFVFSPKQENDGVTAFKIIDFNASFLLRGRTEPVLAPANGTLIFKAPEIRRDYIHQNVEITRKADVWAFGLMIYGIYYMKNNHFTDLDKKVNRYEQIDEELEEYRNNTNANTLLDRLIKDCIQIEPEDRPSMEDILPLLKVK